MDISSLLICDSLICSLFFSSSRVFHRAKYFSFHETQFIHLAIMNFAFNVLFKNWLPNPRSQRLFLFFLLKVYSCVLYI